MEAIDRDFEDFFENCRKQGFSTSQMLTICAPLIWQQRIRKAKPWAIFVFLLLAVYFLYQWIDGFGWFLSSIGRLLLIQLLPYWNWTPLYTTRCLIESNAKNQPTKAMSSSRAYETDAGNCVLCESLESISVATNVTFSVLDTKYLERGLPILVTDSHKSTTLNEFLELMLNAAPHFLESEPCDVSTNLMLKKLFNLEIALHKMRSIEMLSKWFLQLRNCRFNAVKASRAFVKRPYYYPLHLEPFYSSWVLLTHSYPLRQREIFLQGLVFVQQLSGYFDIRLRPKKPCENSCPVVNIRLIAGECLVFSTDLWILSYGTESIETRTVSIATVLEIDWQM